MKFDIMEIKRIINAKLATEVDFRATEVEKIYVEEDGVKIFFITTSNEIGKRNIGYAQEEEGTFIWWYDVANRRMFKIKDCVCEYIES